MKVALGVQESKMKSDYEFAVELSKFYDTSNFVDEQPDYDDASLAIAEYVRERTYHIQVENKVFYDALKCMIGTNGIKTLLDADGPDAPRNKGDSKMKDSGIPLFNQSNEIIKLQKENAQYREALQKIAKNDWGMGNMAPVTIARGALEKERGKAIEEGKSND